MGNPPTPRLGASDIERAIFEMEQLAKWHIRRDKQVLAFTGKPASEMIAEAIVFLKKYEAVSHG